MEVKGGGFEMIYELTVSVNQAKGASPAVCYSNGTGNLTVRGTGGRPLIRFVLSTPGWVFTAITFDTLEGIPVQSDGRPVFFNRTSLPATTIEVDDDLDLQNVGTIYRYKYTLTLESDGTTLVDDPELQNQREPKLGGP